MKIIPDILANNIDDYVASMRIARQLTDRFHIDIIDGVFVDNKTIQPRDIQKQIDNKLDVHLMVEDPLYYARESIALNPYTVIVQYESKGKVKDALELIKKNGFRAGLSINPETSVESIKNYLSLLDHLQVMGYRAGFAGAKLQRSVLAKAEEVRKINPNIELGLDGGVNLSNVLSIKKSGFDTADVNSFLFNNQEHEPISAYSQLLEKII